MAWLGGGLADLTSDLVKANKANKNKSSSNLLTLATENENPTPPLDEEVIARLKEATKLNEKEIIQKHEEFYQMFPDKKGVSRRNFRRLSCHVLDDESEAADFSNKIFNLFDSDKSNHLDFEEFTLATVQHDTKGFPLQKLAWYFDHVYDKVRIKCEYHLNNLLDR